MSYNPRILKPYERSKPGDDCMEEACGVFGVFMADRFFDAAEAAYFGLYALQHRGQESAGIAVSDGKRIKYEKNMGLISEVFKDGLKGLENATIAMGHVRYSTTGESHLYNAQPLVIMSKTGHIALAHNGNLINAHRLREELENEGAIFQTTIDTEIIAALIARNSQNGILSAIEKTMGMIHGSYALVIMTEDKLIGVRDPLGIRPLALGKLGNSYILASESCAFDVLDAEFIRDVRPGEIIVIDRDGLKSHRATALLDSALCIFEFVYFARPDSDIDGINVHEAREKAGARLAIANPVEAASCLWPGCLPCTAAKVTVFTYVIQSKNT